MIRSKYKRFRLYSDSSDQTCQSSLLNLRLNDAALQVYKQVEQFEPQFVLTCQGEEEINIIWGQILYHLFTNSDIRFWVFEIVSQFNDPFTAFLKTFIIEPFSYLFYPNTIRGLESSQLRFIQCSELRSSETYYNMLQKMFNVKNLDNGSNVDIEYFNSVEEDLEEEEDLSFNGEIILSYHQMMHKIRYFLFTSEGKTHLFGLFMRFFNTFDVLDNILNNKIAIIIRENNCLECLQLPSYAYPLIKKLLVHPTISYYSSFDHFEGEDSFNNFFSFQPVQSDFDESDEISAFTSLDLRFSQDFYSFNLLQNTPKLQYVDLFNLQEEIFNVKFSSLFPLIDSLLSNNEANAETMEVLDTILQDNSTRPNLEDVPDSILAIEDILNVSNSDNPDSIRQESNSSYSESGGEEEVYVMNPDSPANKLIFLKFAQTFGVIIYFAKHRNCNKPKDLGRLLMFPKVYLIESEIQEHIPWLTCELLITNARQLPNCEVPNFTPAPSFFATQLHFSRTDKAIKLKDDFAELVDPDVMLLCEFKVFKSFFKETSVVSKLTRRTSFSFPQKDFLSGQELVEKQFDERCNKNPEIRRFKEEVDTYIGKIPTFFTKIHQGQANRINSLLALYHINRDIDFPRGGLSSIKVKGLMDVIARSHKGVFIIPKENQRLTDENQNLLDQAYDFLKATHPFFKNIGRIKEDDLSLLQYAFGYVNSAIHDQPFVLFDTIADIQKARGDGIGRTDMRFSENARIGCELKVTLPFEHAVAACYPILFPLGPLTNIPGKTLRAKAQNLLLCHPWFNFGKLQGVFSLFLFNQILRMETIFQFANIKMRQQHIPQGANTVDITPPNLRSSEPVLPRYWFLQRQILFAYCGVIGLPCMMCTLTMGNWDEKNPTITQLKIAVGNDIKLPMEYAPLQLMKMWEQRFNKIKARIFVQLAVKLGLGKIDHYFSRLEFQQRGNPHAHVLIWLHQKLTVAQYGIINSAQIAPAYCKKQKSNTFVHICKPDRCYSTQHGTCRLGFPRPLSNDTHLGDNNRIIYKRKKTEEQFLTERPLIGVLVWDGHIHILPLSYADTRLLDAACVAYAVKYVSKTEIAGTVKVHPTALDILKGILLTVPQAISRIFSFQYICHDLTVIIVDVTQPAFRLIKIKQGVKFQIPDVQKYFNRPPEMANISFLDFYSLFSIITTTMKCPKNKHAALDPVRPKGSLKFGLNWEKNNLQFNQTQKSFLIMREEDFPGSKSLQAYKRSDPCIVNFTHYDPIKQKKAFLYVILLISGCWRSEEEMLQGFGSDYEKAIEYHEIKLPKTDCVSINVKCFIKFILTTNIYSSYEILFAAKCLLKQKVDINHLILMARKFTNDTNAEKVDLFIEEAKTISEIEEIISIPVVSVNIRHSNIFKLFINYDFPENEQSNALRDFTHMRELLNEGQAKIIDAFINNEGIAKLYSVLGAAGAGKTFLLRTLKNYLISKNQPFLFTAATGIAAILLCGKTIHTAFRISSKGQNYFSNLLISSQQGLALSELKYLIIDEVSMLHKNLFNLLDAKLRELMGARYGNHRYSMSFGGVTVMITGDISQVPVIDAMSVGGTNAQSMFTEMTAMPSFTKFELITLCRLDHNDPDALAFANILEEVRGGMDKLSPESLRHLKNRYRRIVFTGHDYWKMYEECGDEGLIVFYRNQQVRECNECIAKKEAERLNQPIVTIKGCCFTSKTEAYLGRFGTQSNHQSVNNMFQPEISSDIDTDRFISARRKGPSNTVQDFYKLFVGAKVMLLKNIDTSKGLVNGRRGIVTNITLNDQRRTVSAITVEFFSVGSEFPKIKVPIVWQSIDSMQMPEGITITMYQIPLTLCYAVTAHKVQGQTLLKVFVAIKDPAFAHGSFYVAISRVKRLSDLILFGSDEFPPNGPEFKVDPSISRILDEYRILMDE